MIRSRQSAGLFYFDLLGGILLNRGSIFANIEKKEMEIV